MFIMYSYEVIGVRIFEDSTINIDITTNVDYNSNYIFFFKQEAIRVNAKEDS